MGLLPEALSAAGHAWRPPEDLRPSEWAARYRYLKPGTTDEPGLWSNDRFPYLVSIMDAVDEALRTGKRGLVLMKSGQGGGSEAMINVLYWLRCRYAGAFLYLISKDELAREFGRERFSYVDETSPPVKEIAQRGRAAGELTHIKRYRKGKIAIHGGQSVLNIESTPYRFVFVDEVDSLQSEIAGRGDPLATAEVRTDAFFGKTLIIAFAHPTVKEHGAGELYYERSDQRRGHVECPHCSEWFWLNWERDVKVLPRGGESLATAERDPTRYAYVTPCCGVELTDGERYSACRNVQQRSTIDPEEAAKKTWMGVHFSQLYMANKPLAFLASKHIEGLDDTGKSRVFTNKRLGDVFVPKVLETRADDWRACVVLPRDADDTSAYRLGQVPPAVRFLTAGQDSRARELHYSVWGWGLVATETGGTLLCGWLIDCGVIEREAPTPTLDVEDLRPLEQVIYQPQWARTDDTGSLGVESCYHDSGWQPIAVYEFCRGRGGRAVPCKGAAETSDSTAPVHRWGASPRYRVRGVEVSDTSLRLARLNTYRLKEQLIALVGRRFVDGDGERRPRIHLPVDVPDEWLAQSSAEYLAETRKGLVWKARGPNHWADCNAYAYAAALQLNPFTRGRTRAEVQAAEAAQKEARRNVSNRRAAKPAKRRIRRRY